MRFVHIADLHVGRSFKTASFAKGFGQMKREAIGSNLQSVVSYCNEQRIDLMLIAGDFIDSEYVDITDMYELTYRLKQLRHTKVVLIAGNHDPLTPKDSVYQMVDWPAHVYIVSGQTELLEYEDLDTCIVARSWVNKGPMDFDKESVARCIDQTTMTNKIVMLHGDCYQDNGYHYMNPKELKSLGAHYYAIGHIHKPDVLEGCIVYPGSLEPLDFKELGDHGFITGEIKDGDLHFEPELSMKHGMSYIDVDITDAESVLEIAERCEDALDMAIEQTMIRLQLIGEKHLILSDITEKLYERLSDTCVYPKGHIAYIEIKDLTVMAYDIEVLKKEHKDDIIGKFIEVMSKEQDEISKDALKEGLSLLLEVSG